MFLLLGIEEIDDEFYWLLTTVTTSQIINFINFIKKRISYYY